VKKAIPLLVLLAAPLCAAAGPKTDLVVLVNGDHLTGEIKGLSRGKLDYSTDDAGRLSIEWVKVVRVTSPHVFELETTAGERRYGALVAPEGGPGLVRLDDGTSLAVEEIVSLVPLDTGLASRLQAYLDLGFTFAKSNTATTLNTDGFVGYRGEWLGASLEYQLYLQGAENNPLATRSLLRAVGEAYAGRWTAQLIAQAERNDELELKLRVTLGAGTAYRALRSNNMELSFQGGLAGLSERYLGADTAYYLTGYLAGVWDAFRYDTPKLDVGIALTAYPYLTDLGRLRLQLDLRVKYELFADFNVGITFGDTFDSRPPDPSASNNDFVTSVTVGWSYRR
jgi:hypothetical protein